MSRLEAAIAMTERLVAFDTESAKSNLDLIADVESYLREQGVAFLRIPNEAGDKAALFTTIGPNVEGGVLLSGHTDVVPVAGQAWSADPFKLRREGERLIGRGAVDMKGFDAVCLAMIPEFKAAALKRPIHILLSYDEETTCVGPIDAIRRFGHDLPSHNGDGRWSLPVPATYVVDRDGRIVLAFVDPDYRKRLEPAAAIAALRKIKVAETT